MNRVFQAYCNGIVIGLMFIAPAVVITKVLTDDAWRSQIAERGCAEFYLDSAADRQWRWKGFKP